MENLWNRKIRVFEIWELLRRLIFVKGIFKGWDRFEEALVKEECVRGGCWFDIK